MKLTKCPRCGESDELGDKWQSNRKLQQYCRDCGWIGELRTPEKKKIETKKKIYVNQFYGWSYNIYDKYGYNLISSRTYNIRNDAVKGLKDDLKRFDIDSDISPCTGVLWPAFVEVKGEVFKGKTG